jgi:RimJ/RimL family protein N-acetyltransferase
MTVVDGDETGSAVLADGTVVEIRPIRADDVPLLVEFHEGLSVETSYRRFFGVHPHLNPGEAEHFCCVDSLDRFALVGVVKKEIVAVARLEGLQPAETAEVAFVVADRYQHRGLGPILVQRLAAAARARGVTKFVAETLADNRAMLRLLPAAGFEVNISREDGYVTLTCAIGASADQPGTSGITESPGPTS